MPPKAPTPRGNRGGAELKKSPSNLGKAPLVVSPTKASLDSSRVLRTGPGSSGQDSSRQGTARAAPTTKVERKARERAGDMGPNGLTLRDSTRHLPANYREETIANSKLVSEKTKLKERAELAEAALEPTAAKAKLLQFEVSELKAQLHATQSKLELSEAEKDLITMDLTRDFDASLNEIDTIRNDVTDELQEMKSALEQAEAEAGNARTDAERERGVAAAETAKLKDDIRKWEADAAAARPRPKR